MRLLYYLKASFLLPALFLLFSNTSIAGPPCSAKASFTGTFAICSGSTSAYIGTKTTGHYYRWVVSGGQILSGQGSDTINVYWPDEVTGSVKLIDSMSSTCKDSLQKTVKVGLSASTLAQSGYAVLGSATGSGKTYSVTTNSGSQVGAAWNKSLINLTKNFDFTFKMYQCGGADGMMFVLQNSGLKSIGSGTYGSAMGYYDAPSGTFDQSIGVEFDIYKSGTGYNDSSDSHIALVKNKSTNSIKSQAEISFLSTANVYHDKLGSCRHYKFRITWNSDLKILTGYFIDSGGASYKVFNWSNDIVKNVFNGNPNVYFGFTGGTGAITSTQSFANDTLIYGKPNVSIKGNSVLCAGDSTTLSTSAAAAYLWSTGDTTQTVRVKKGGKYSVIAMDSTGCTAYSDTLTIKVNPAVVPHPGINQFICPGSKAVIGAPAVTGYSYSWYSNPSGYTSSLAMDTVSPKVTTTYYLSVTDKSTGCSKMSPVTVFISPIPSVAFTAVSNCLYAPITFTNSSTSTTGQHLKYTWKFDDGTFSTDSIPVRKSFSKAGVHTVWLIAETDSGCRDSISKKVTVFAAPTVDFSASNTCAGQQTVFTNNSTLVSGNINGYHWNFGDGTTSTATSPGKTYASGGTYTVWLTATSDRGCKDSVSKTITVSTKPVSAFSVSGGCATDSVRFTNMSTIGAGHTISGYSWDFGDGSQSILKDPYHKYTKPGTYTVSLVSTADGGCDDTLKQSVTINAGPTVKIGGNMNVCVGTTVQFYDSSTVAGPATITGRIWNFGDKSSTSSTANPTHTYALPGTYWVWLYSQTSSGCKDSASTLVQVNKLPDTGFTATLVKGRQYNFAANDKVSAVYQWNFGDNTTATGATTSHTYANNGIYTVSLRMANLDSCTESTTHSLNVNANGIAEQMEHELGIQLYPNPSHEQFTLGYSLNKLSMVKVAVMDITGKQIALIAQGNQPAGSYTYNVSANDYHMQAGVYMIQITVDGQVVNKPLVQLK